MEKIKFFEDSLLVYDKILVFSDLHLGYEEFITTGLNQKFNLKEIKEKIDKIYKKIKKKRIEKIVILGDIKHDFKELTNNDWREVLDILDYLSKITEEIIIIRGNHDNYIFNVLKKKKIKILDYYQFKDIIFIHGDKKILLDKEKKIILMGHLHPSVTLFDSYKQERFKCFLHYYNKETEYYILPSFNDISYGFNLNNIKNEKEKSILSNKEIIGSEVMIYNTTDNKIISFGKLKKLI